MRCRTNRAEKPHAGAAFTLLELLIVIAVIAIVAAILFPVFAHARAKARQAACLSNERQIWMAVAMYANDNDETLPFWQAAFLTSPATQNTTKGLWKSAVEPYIKGGEAAGIPEPESGVWQCPSSGAWRDGLDSNLPPISRASTASYGMSMFIAYDFFDPKPKPPVTRYRPGLPLAALRSPANTVFMGEGGMAGRIDSPVQERWMDFERRYHADNVQNWERRDVHNGGSNYLFCDGHARWEGKDVMYPEDKTAAKQSALKYFAATDADYRALGGTE